jgi:hypothetical protein
MKSLPGKRAVMVFLIVAAVMMMPLAASADLLNVDLSGSRSTPSTGGVVASDGWMAGDNGGFTISWEITTVGNNFLYQYTFTNFDETSPTTPGISHLLLEVSDNFMPADIWGATINGISVTAVGPTTFVGTNIPATTPGDNNGNPNLPANLFGIKLELPAMDPSPDPITFSFTSTRAPMWGDFYVKDGKQDGVIATAWNTAIGTDPGVNTIDFTGWIAVPNTVTGVGVPVPPTVWLMGSGLIGVGLLGWRRKKS